MIEAASCKDVSRNELTLGGTVAAISAIRSSGIGPGPLGIADTSPIAFAPASIAIHASATLAMQQIFIRGLTVGFITYLWSGRRLGVRQLVGALVFLPKR
jgi:hypothetical protein